MSVQQLHEHHFEFLPLKGGCTGSSESTLVKMPHCWKSHVVAQLLWMITKPKVNYGYLTLSILVDFPIHIDTISACLGLSI